MRRIPLFILMTCALAQGGDPTFKERVATWPLDDFAGLVKWVRAQEGVTNKEKSERLRARALDLVLAQPDAGAAGLRLLTDEEREGLGDVVARHLGLRAGDWIAEQRTGTEVVNCLLALLDPMIDANLPATLRTLAEWPDPQQRRRLLDSLGYKWAARDPLAVLNWAESLPPDLRADARRNGLLQLSYSSREDAYARILALPPGPERDRLAYEVVAVRAGNEPCGFLWCAAYPDAEVARELVRKCGTRIGVSVTYSDANKVRRLAAEINESINALPDARGRAAARESVNTWINALPDAPRRKAAREGAVDTIVGNLDAPDLARNPKALLALIGTSESPAEREKLLQQAETIWNKRFPDQPLR